MNMASEDAPPCIIHQGNVANEEVKRFTSVRWDKWRESVNKWLVLDGHERRLAESAGVKISSSPRGSYHFLKRDCVADAVPLYQDTHWNWYSFRRPWKDDRLSA